MVHGARSRSLHAPISSPHPPGRRTSGDRDAEGLGGVEVEDESNLVGCSPAGRPASRLEDLVHVGSGAAIPAEKDPAIGHQAPSTPPTTAIPSSVRFNPAVEAKSTISFWYAGSSVGSSITKRVAGRRPPWRRPARSRGPPHFHRLVTSSRGPASTLAAGLGECSNSSHTTRAAVGTMSLSS